MALLEPLPTRTRPKTVPEALAPHEMSAVRWLVRWVIDAVPARLVEAALFGSRARGDAGPDSDVDVLLIFEWLPPDREPHATWAEGIAAEVARSTRVPVTVWSVSLIDLEPGNRTPMLVDALIDAIPIWSLGDPIEVVPFTSADARRCAASLLDRVSEGSAEFATALDRGDLEHAAMRARDDIVRLCTALLLLRGSTRPRRAEAVAEAMALDGVSAAEDADILAWARDSFGPLGKDADRPVPPPPGGLSAAAAAIDRLGAEVRARLGDLSMAPGAAIAGITNQR